MKIFILHLFLLSATSMNAQSDAVASGGTASGTTGTSTYTVGQTAYRYERNNQHSSNEGMQQPFEIRPLTTAGFSDNPTAIKIYPNPAFSGFYIALPETAANSEYTLIDTNGKTLRKGKLTETETFVRVSEFTSGIYILNITDANRKSNSYKIIKK